MELALCPVTTFRAIIDVLKDLRREVNLDCSITGIEVFTLDMSNVALVVLVLPATMFHKYSCPTPVTLGIHLASLAQILHMADPEVMLELVYEKNSTSFSVKLENMTSTVVTEFAVQLMTIESHRIEPHEQQYPVVVSLPSQKLLKIIRHLKEFGSELHVNARADSLRLSVNGLQGVGSVLLRQTKSDSESESVRIQASEPVEAVFSSQYLLQFAKAACLSPVAVVSVGADMPIKVQYNFDDANSGYMQYLLAQLAEE